LPQDDVHPAFVVGSPVVLLAGLTGGIGSGKSTVAAMLVELGAVLIDADQIAREVVAPGGVAYQPVIDRFGPGILAQDGSIDRPALADIVFRDPAARKDLEAVTHPAVGKVMAERVASHTDSDEIVVLDIPLLAERGRMGVEKVVVVDCPEETALERLVSQRGFAADDVRRRIAAQLSRAERRALADIVIVNDKTLAHLRTEVNRAWAQLSGGRLDPPPS
jgi:dephospho-CoA kinase